MRIIRLYIYLETLRNFRQSMLAYFTMKVNFLMLEHYEPISLDKEVSGNYFSYFSK